jgi:hypothetical protein
LARKKAETADPLTTAQRLGSLIKSARDIMRKAAIIDQDLDFAFYVSLCLLKPFREYVSVP